MPAAGKLDRLVTILRETVTSEDELGQPVMQWVPWGPRRWMGKRSVTAAERFRANQELATETVVFDSHWIDGLEHTDRLECEGKLYDIEAIAEVGRREGLEIVGTARAE